MGYASTVHAAEGRTVDTSHAVFGRGTDLAGLLVPLTRGRESNTAWVITTPLAVDAETGETFDVRARTARAILADVVENAREELSALAERERAEVEARSTMTHVDQLIAVAEQVTTGRTSAALDRLAAVGALTPPERAQLAADDTIWSLERLLRTAELAGHDPDQVLADAVAARELDGARSLAQVIHHRITKTLEGQLTPHLTSATDLIPRDAPDDYRAWLTRRAEAADARRHELGAETAEQAPAWALDALGPVPEDVVERQEWEHRAGWAAAWRELAGHTDEHDPLGAAPPRGQVEKAALFRAAHEALRLLDAGHEEAGMTDGRLRIRVRALEQEEAWAPRHVDEELAATHAAADKARADATVWAARAEAPDISDVDREQLRAAAVDAERRADELTEQVAALEEADMARARWFVETAVTRDLADRSRAELRARGVDSDDTSDHVTAAEWLDAHLADQAAEDDVREIHDEHDFYDADQDDAASAAVPPTDVRDGRAHRERARRAWPAAAGPDAGRDLRGRRPGAGRARRDRATPPGRRRTRRPRRRRGRSGRGTRPLGRAGPDARRRGGRRQLRRDGALIEVGAAATAAAPTLTRNPAASSARASACDVPGPPLPPHRQQLRHRLGERSIRVAGGRAPLRRPGRQPARSHRPDVQLERVPAEHMPVEVGVDARPARSEPAPPRAAPAPCRGRRTPRPPPAASRTAATATAPTPPPRPRRPRRGRTAGSPRCRCTARPGAATACAPSAADTTRQRAAARRRPRRSPARSPRRRQRSRRPSSCPAV